jgi:hypothetical protein
MATTLAALITSCRTIAADGPSDNFQRAENVNDAEFGFPIDGYNTTFVTKNIPVVPGGFQKVVVDNITLVPTAYTVNEAIGEIVLLVPPLTSIYVSYYFYLFADVVWTEFIVGALQLTNLSSGVVLTDVASLPENFIPVVKAYANSYFCRRVANQTGLWYNQRLQERVEDRDNISAKWLRLAESAQKQADALLVQAYSGNASQNAPSFRIGGFQPQSYTPSR